MTYLTCAEARDAAAEYALDILEPEERSALAAHLLRCPSCRAEVDAMSEVATRLIELVPGTEPPLGFDRRVMARVRDITPSRSRRLVPLRTRRARLLAAIGAVAAAVALVFGSIGWLMGHSSHPASHQLLAAATFHQSGRNVGNVDVYRDDNDPVWLNMTVHDVKGGPTVTCELVAADGKLTPLGSFDLVDGSGSWGAPDPGGLAGITGARLTDSHGRVIATATFPV